ncbi:MAG: ankyrin repeat domain-containing protein [Wolbachia sp.]|nr:ankyrin repeat domain-containing protein [Wolbachia sp.]MDD9336345.1 ankyrin repeat domain-containing protein [Wolbachia sp.]
MLLHGKDDNTPIHIAILFNKRGLVDDLIKKGADINKPNKHGHTPLFLALENKKVTVV